MARKWSKVYDGRDSDGYRVIWYDSKDKHGSLQIIQNPGLKGGWGVAYIDRKNIKKSKQKLDFKTRASAMEYANKLKKVM